MKLNTATFSIECSQQAFAAEFTKCIFGSSSASMKEKRREYHSMINNILISSPSKSRKLLRSQSLENKSLPKICAIRRSCSANFDDEKEWLDDAEDLISKSKMRFKASNSLEILDPISLGIVPEPPNWPERESILLTQKAKSFDFPNSLRMIQKKMQLSKGLKVLEESASCSVKKAFSSLVFIMIELQSSALKMRQVLCNEDLEMIINKVQKDMHSSFAWLFQQVFPRTPALMIYVMILLANFSLHSTSLNVAVAQASLLIGTTMEMESFQQHALTDNKGSSYGTKDELVMKSKMYANNNTSPYGEVLQVADQELKSVPEVFLWNSVLDEATKMQDGAVLDHELLQRFVSPISVELEADDYDSSDYIRIDIKYQIALSQDPNNPLLLCNYAKFLLLVVHDLDRAEECFKKAVKADPPDAESHCQYADFLWKVRDDLWGAEQRYLEALAADPNNTYNVSKYAEFLWRTGGDETCFPVCASNKNDVK
ncbi:hypothetical protein M9H77_10884 [Catharanthus roseus]|uniref:Uncharacterized protein n=1 Tax=Catharanthus roseus TaxID=4058 RepID=A0ACC0BCW9_CATRO|nr:hypothetical protein M9H77_10884 [Catharanthus roseus]